MRVRATPAERVCRAIVDGTPVEWDRLASERHSSPDGAVLEQLSTIAAIARTLERPAGRTFVHGRHTLTRFANLLTAVATVRIVVAVGCLLVLGWRARGWPPGVSPTFCVIVLAYGGSGAVLLRANRADVRAASLGLVFLLIATSFANGLYGGVAAAAHAQTALTAFPVDCFLAYGLWMFVRDFPADAAGRSRRWLSDAVRVSWVAAFVLLSANAAPVMFTGLQHLWWLEALQRRSAKGTIYWSVVFALVLAAMPALVGRTIAAGEQARQRGWLFLSGLTLGLFPLSALIVLEAISSRFQALSAAYRPVINATALGFLLTIPITTAYAVLVREVLSVKVLMRRTLQYSLARSTLVAGSLIPFGFVVAHVYTERTLPVAVVFGSARVKATAVLFASGLVLLGIRQRVQTMVDRAFFRAAYDPAAAMAALLDETQRSRSVEELALAAVERIVATLGLYSAAVLLMSEEGALVPLGGAVAGLPAGSALAAVLSSSAMPLYIDLDRRSPAARLPEEEVFWLTDHDVRALVPLQGAVGALLGVVVLGAAKSDESLEQAHGGFITALGPGLAGPLDHRLASLDRRRFGSADMSVDRARDCVACGRVSPSGSVTCTACAAPTTPSAVPLVVSGKFRIERKVASGGMGVVYRAVDTSLDRAVAIKTLPRVSPEDAVRLRREGRAMATLSHANLATAFGIETWRGTPMLVVEYLSGGTLADRLRDGALPLVDCVAIIQAVLSGLSHAHDRGILHRDLKPSNIGFTEDGVPKVLDFGLARLTEDLSAPPGVARTRAAADDGLLTDRRVGTPAYMSPEALRGETPGPGFDLWSAAVVMVEMLTGRPPFPPRPDGWREVLQDQPEALVTPLIAALDPAPGRRPASAREFSKAITSSIGQWR